MSTLGRFTILGELGRGGMGVVFRAHDPDMARDVAIKVLRQDDSLAAADLEEAARRFDREAKAAGGLNHPNIVAHYERGQANQWKYIVMELVDGRSLSDVMATGPRPAPAEILSILRQMAAALDYAHSRGVIHRDIKPGNVLLQAGGTVKIADFGVAKCSLPGAATSSSMVIGSPHYMAPEQIEAQPVTARTDQWALAVTAYELLAGRKPFQSDSMASLFQLILAGTPPDARSLDPSLTPAVNRVFRTALDKCPESRYPDCASFVDALAGALSGARAEPPAKSSPHSRRVPVWSWAAALAVVALLGAFAKWGTARAPGSKPAAPAARAPLPGGVRVNQRDRLLYVWIPPGQFRMGCSPGDTQCRDDEKARDVVVSNGYWCARTEVTTGAYKRFSVVTGQKLPAAPEFNPGWTDDDLPVTNVTWDDAAKYCRWAQGRLPTEIEWEYAARAGSTDARYGPAGDIAWSRANSGLRAHRVAGKAPNALGLYDTLGNVWEWTQDRYPEERGNFRVLRGGGWVRDPAEIRVSQRYPLSPENPDQAIGFRCVADDLP